MALASSERVDRSIRVLDLAPFRQVRLAKGWSRAELNRLSDVSEHTIKAIENGIVKDPNIETVARLVKALDLQMRDVVKVPYHVRMLSDLRHLAGLSQTSLARRAGMSPPALARLERAETDMTDEKAQALARVLRTTASTVHAAWRRAKNRPPGTSA
ncbi:transcriptional regulator, XRE family [Segniliparus rotundus DSM 44985]|uniref:Transcriptional regulator, XRE family n=1 Tax=Segniliparus rotundus (strain ATCC BAA-972 / CDC 1076 / CIP 108378 / DSM 44985 / JCM 13578) TaxID=640132 RepID=D6ZFS2_SEGRD|nr:helix-turn-helix transcriptional regulator [Segniliparus rotundus]ADG97796.1 transcriptional regulator, XRE family [Segniliparus rotundus DSM 44985]